MVHTPNRDEPNGHLVGECDGILNIHVGFNLSNVVGLLVQPSVDKGNGEVGTLQVGRKPVEKLFKVGKLGILLHKVC